MSEYQRPGWYPDPDGTPGERWWNGSGWSDSRRGGVSPTPPPSVAPVPAVISPVNPPRPDPYAQPVPTAATLRSAITVNAGTNQPAMVGFVTGLIALFFNVLMIPAILALIMSIRGIVRANQLKAQGSHATGMLFAVLGLVFGIVSILIGFSAGLLAILFASTPS